MWRALFLACGIFGCILGGQCLVVDSFVMADESAPHAAEPATLFGAGPMAVQSKDYKPPEWAPWTLLSAGAVIVLYSLTINRSSAA
jgi:hypothetical protein